MLKTCRTLAAVLALVIFCAAATPSCHGLDIDPEKVTEIRKMLELTGASKMAQLVMNQMLDGMKGGKNLSNESIDRLKKKLNADELMEMIIPIYDKYYTTEDLKAVNAFYSSPAGKKLLESMPQVMKESMKVGQEWGQKIGKKIALALEAEENEK